MSPGQRGALGATVGAILVLFVRHETRPALLAAFTPASTRTLETLLGRPDLVRPTDLDSAAAFLHAGADRLEGGRPLSTAERKTLLELASQGREREPDNPFWSLADAVFRSAQDGESRRAWRRASEGVRYYDHQRAVVRQTLRRFATAGDAPSWAYAAVAPTRSASMVVQVRKTALRLMRGFEEDGARTELAYETIRIGAMVRDGGERLNLGHEGIEMIEEATYPPGALRAGVGSPVRRLWIAKTTLTRTLRRTGRLEEAAFCDRQFRRNDAELAMEDILAPDERFRSLAIAAVLADTVPGASLFVSAVGALLWLVGARSTILARSVNRFIGPGLGAAALSLAFAGFLCGTPWIGLAAGMCVLLPGASPQRPRSYDGEPLGPLHVLVVWTAGMALALTSMLAAVASSLPGSLLPSLGFYGGLLGNGRQWCALVIAFLGFSALAPPAWAFVRRYSTPVIAARTYTVLGRGMVCGGLLLAIVSSPLCFALDRWLGNALAEIALNEQNAYSPAGSVK